MNVVGPSDGSHINATEVEPEPASMHVLVASAHASPTSIIAVGAHERDVLSLVSLIPAEIENCCSFSFEAGRIAAVTAEAAINTNPRMESFLRFSFCIKNNL
jgi:hypothetical protein